jgi:hypothetical protein
MLFLAAGMFANFFFGTLYVQDILHYSPIGAGLAFLPMALLIGVGAGAAQKLIPRFGIRTVAIGGMALAAAGLALMVRVSVHGTYVGTLLPSFVLLAIGLGIAFVPATLIGVSSVSGRGFRARVGALQHGTAGRWRARTGDPLDDRRDPHQQPACG